jgi:hypothetical protein
MAKHQKASDLFLRSGATLVTFAEAFPTVDEAEVEVEEIDRPFRKTLLDVRLTSKGKELAECYDCGNPRCSGGGVSIGEVLRHMVKESLTEHETPVIACQGWEGSPKGRKKDKRCLRRFKIKARIKYKAPPAQPE